MADDLLYTDDAEWWAADLRGVFSVFDEGVLDIAGGDLLVTDGATGLSIDVAAGIGFVEGDDDPDQGLYRVRVDTDTNSEAFLDGGIEPADATNPRIDRIVARVYDDAVDSSGMTAFQLEVLTGVPTAGADLGDLLGAVAVPPSAMLLANVLVEVGDSSIDPANVDDVRTDAKGSIGGIHGVTHEEGGSDPIPSLPTADEKAALDAAAAPDATNPFATLDDLGGGGGGTVQVESELAGVPIVADKIIFGASDTRPTVTDNLDGSVTVRDTAVRLFPPKATRSSATGSIANNAIGDVEWDWLDWWGNGNDDLETISGGQVLKVAASDECRVRLYGDPADRTADAARASGVDPTGDHGVYLDFTLTSGMLSKRLSPAVTVVNWVGGDGEIYGAITNLSGGSADIDVTLTLVPLMSG